ncbi:MAG: ABC transporter ATP-binding protein [Rhodospirillaceae bacterium]|nr:ABC transporter ATP-binding protein [Rhodospirillaceae bacterium]|tara:strand:+ start:2529 stop:3464 length:936 start_codon:yes stop_codon:yes gene_type:complete
MINCKALTKKYGNFVAVNELTFQVQAGEVLGFLGPNGAGKTTTMRILAGFLSPTAGKASVCGFDVETQSTEAKRKIGYLPEGAPSYPEMTSRSFLEFIADSRKISISNRQRRLEEVHELLQLGTVLDQKIDTLSKGFRRRVGLAQAILHDPEVLILDEPTDGLDPNQKHEVRRLINRMSERKIIIISTHLLEEVDAVCNRAIIISDGKILADDSPKNLESKSKFHNAVSVKLLNSMNLNIVDSAINSLPEVASTRIDENNNSLIAFPTKGKTPLEAITKLGAAEGWDFSELHVESGRLDEVFRSITGGTAR